MSGDRWLDYSGPLCDDPAELVGLDVPDAADLAGLEDWLFTRAEPDDRGVLWEELAPAERAYLSKAAQR